MYVRMYAFMYVETQVGMCIYVTVRMPQRYGERLYICIFIYVYMYTDVSAADKTKYDFILNLFIPTPAIASCQGHVFMEKNAHVRTHRPVLKSTIVVSTFSVPI